MFRFGHNLKVLRAIVGGVLVDVVNNLRLAKKAPKFGLHDKPVLHDIPLAVCIGMPWDQPGAVCPMPSIIDYTLKVGVPLSSDFGALPCRLTFHRAKLLGSFAGMRNVLSALAAFENEIDQLADTALACLPGDIGPTMSAMILIAAYCGPRPGELMELKWTDVHGDELNISRSLDATGQIKPTKRSQS